MSKGVFGQQMLGAPRKDGLSTQPFMAYKDVTPPAGAKISISGGKLTVPDNPIVPFIRGDGTGPDIWAASVRVFDAAVEKCYGGQRRIHWMEGFAGESAFRQF